MGAVMPTATLPRVTASHAYVDDLILDDHPVQRGLMKVPEGPGLGITMDEDVIERFSKNNHMTWLRHITVVTLPGGVEHYYRSLPQAERLMKQGVDDAFAPGITLHEWEDDGTDRFDKLWQRLQGDDWPIFTE